MLPQTPSAAIAKPPFSFLPPSLLSKVYSESPCFILFLLSVLAELLALKIGENAQFFGKVYSTEIVGFLLISGNPTAVVNMPAKEVPTREKKFLTFEEAKHSIKKKAFKNRRVVISFLDGRLTDLIQRQPK